MNVMRLGWSLVHFLWQGALIAGIYAAVRCFLTGANARYVLACATLALMMAAPVTTWFVLGQSDAPAAVAADRTARVPSTATPLPFAVISTVPAVRPLPWLQWAVTTWLLGASLLSARLLGGWAMAARLRWTFTRPAPPEWSLARIGCGRTRAGARRRPASLRHSAIAGSDRRLAAADSGTGGDARRPSRCASGSAAAARTRAHKAPRLPCEPATKRSRNAAVLSSSRMVGIGPYSRGARALLRRCRRLRAAMC